MAKKPIAYLMRHGEALHEDELMAGRGCDFPLSEKGEAQAAAAAKKLKELDFGSVYSSPMLRAVQTAQLAVGNRCITQDRCLFPWALGPQFDGEDKEEQKENIKYLTSHPDSVPLHGESLNEAEERVGRFVECHFNEFDPPLLVTHSNVICMVMDSIGGSRTCVPGLQDGMTPTGIMCVYDEDGDLSYEVIYGKAD